MKLAKLLVAIAFVGLSACSRTGAPATHAGPTAIKFATDWKAQAEQGGFYEALATGEYSKRGLDVRIIQGGAAVNVPQLLATNSIDLGLGSNSFDVLNLAAAHAPAKAVMAVMQEDPFVLIAHSGQGIQSIADMKGHPVLLSDNSVDTFWVWLKAKYGLTDDQVRKYDSSAPFLADNRAIEEGYLTSEPFTIAKASGMQPAVFLLADQGYPGYAAMVLASNKIIASNPAAVKAFVEGTAAGWKSYLYGDPRPGDALILKDNPEMTQDLLDFARAKMREKQIVLGGDAKTDGIGAMTDKRWDEFITMATTELPKDFPKTVDYHTAYTLQFLPTAAK